MGTNYESLAYHLHKIGRTVYVVLPNKVRRNCEKLLDEICSCS